MRLDNVDIADLPSRERAALVNSLSGFKSANLVGTADKDGTCNLAIMSSVVHLGSHPPLLALVVRPGGEERHTLANLLRSGHYSINHVGIGMIEAAHQTAARYPADTCEFDATGLTPEWWDEFHAPLVAEAPIKMAMALREHQELAINGTHLVIGEILAVAMPAGCKREDGSLDLAAAGTVALTGLDSYHSTQLVKRMAYAKPDLPPRAISGQ
jgi:flavin reductase (DIM6/NTAB) family NADH-FMN oxidoreductase RutF